MSYDHEKVYRLLGYASQLKERQAGDLIAYGGPCVQTMHKHLELLDAKLDVILEIVMDGEPLTLRQDDADGHGLAEAV